jgi:Sec-independent protein secretion pathway component TatC
MILASGIGSALSDRIDVESSSGSLRAIPFAIAVLLSLTLMGVQPLVDRTIHLPLLARGAIVASLVGVVALPLGTCFPIGLRLVRRLSDDATPWMWGINGAAGVLASVTAVAISMWSGISTSLYLAAIAYLLLAVPAMALWRRGAEGA